MRLLRITLTALILGFTTAQTNYTNWRTFHGHGVNLGGWLVQESTIDTSFWAINSGGASDEWGLCEHLGPQCGPILDHRYATFITTQDIDTLAHTGVRILRIPTTYAAWINLPGSQLYTGNQTAHLRHITSYAIHHYNMHIILDLHSLPGGINGLTIGEATSHWGWFHNETALSHSLDAVDAVLHFIQTSHTPEAFTLEPMNEPADSNQDMRVFGTPAALSAHGAEWVVKYVHAVLARVAAVNPRIPVMVQGSFWPEERWSMHFPADSNIVFDVHSYYFENRNTTAKNLPQFLAYDARRKAGDGKFPVFVGEWAIQTTYNNSLALRGRNLQAGLDSFGAYARGSCYWTAKFSGNGTVDGEGSQRDYWNFETLVGLGDVKLSASLKKVEVNH
ncbi:hypothetical protein FE257_012066 [Aspergillus nanangensis]|uniref:glucan 1,3-beta-glucosidase n=1 Tax=Aspergillus nanangensis TaxID=2582783 RepID=A0AAD4CGL3_ASPNN|nr:hypothetical protein FE257_012066 [Aspergillus nanangensis]